MSELSEHIPAGIISAKLEERDSGKVWPLGRKSRKSCHFSSRFGLDSVEIRFRVDWKDHNENMDPCLDCDFYTPGSKKPITSMKRHPSHQTKKTFDPNSRQWVYDFEYNDLRFRFLLVLTREVSQTGKARIVSPKSTGT